MCVSGDTTHYKSATHVCVWGYYTLQVSHPCVRLGYYTLQVSHPCIRLGYYTLQVSHPCIRLGYYTLQVSHPCIRLGYYTLQVSPQKDCWHMKPALSMPVLIGSYTYDSTCWVYYSRANLTCTPQTVNLCPPGDTGILPIQIGDTYERKIIHPKSISKCHTP